MRNITGFVGLVGVAVVVGVVGSGACLYQAYDVVPCVTSKDCNDNNECTSDVCTAENECQHVPVAEKCDPGTGGNAGTGGDAGTGGSAGQGGGGQGGQGTGGGPTGCKANSECGLDSACLKHVCDVGTGKCSTVAAPMGTDCSSELPNGYCSSGACVKCDASAPASVLAGGLNNNNIKVVLLRNNGTTIVSATANGVFASLPVCLPAVSGDDIGVWSFGIGTDFSTALNHTVSLNTSAKVQCIDGLNNPDASFLQTLVGAPGDFNLNIGGSNPAQSDPNCAALNKTSSLTWYKVQ